MIKVSVEELLIAERPLGILARAKMSPSRAFMVTKLLKAVQKEIEEIREAQQQIIQKYGKRDDHGELVVENNMYPVDPEHKEEFDKEIDDLLRLEYEIPVKPLLITDIDDSIEFTVTDMLQLDKFIVEPE